MQTRIFFIYAGVLALGFGLGWLARPIVNDPQEAVVIDVPKIKDLAPSYNINTANQTEVKQAAPTVPVVYIDDEEDKHNKGAQASTLANNGTGITPDEDWQIEDLLTFIRSASEQQYYDTDGLFTLFANNPDRASELLNHVLDVTDPLTLQRAMQLLSAENHRSNYSIEKQIIEKMRLGDRQNEWLKILSRSGVFTPGGLDFLSEQLSFYPESEQTVHAINAINKGVNVFFNKIPRQTREAVTLQIENHLRADDPAVRGAALRSLSAFPVPDSESFIVDALSDPNYVVQNSAIQALMRGEFQDGKISDALIAMMKDESNSYRVRVMATKALRRYNLEGQDYDDLYNFSQELTANNQQKSTARLELNR